MPEWRENLRGIGVFRVSWVQGHRRCVWLAFALSLDVEPQQPETHQLASDRDIPLIHPGDFAAALGLLTRLPIKVGPVAAARGANSAWAYPLVGVIVGAIAALVAAIALDFTGMPAIAAGFALLSMAACTGALHEDGLADTVDGFWGGWQAERRLEIMKDSRIGTYGVLALVFSAGLRWVALTAVIAGGGLVAALLALCLLSRAPMVAMMYLLPNARSRGLSQGVGRPGQSTTLLALGLALSIGFLLIGFSAIWAALALAVVLFVMLGLARAKIGGQTGDVLGATQQISEIAILLVLLP